MSRRLLLLLAILVATGYAFITVGCGLSQPDGGQGVRVVQLRVEVVGRGTVTPADGGQLQQGATVTLSAVPAAGWRFAGWGGDASGESPTTSLLVLNEPHVTAVFLPISSQTHLEIDGSGTVTPGDLRGVALGDAITLTAVPADGWYFAGWYGSLTGNANPASCVVSADTAIVARFLPAPFTVTVAYPTEEQWIVDPVDVLATVSNSPANDPPVRVEFYLDDSATPIATDTSAPFTWHWDPKASAQGVHEIRAVAFSKNGYSCADTVNATVRSWSVVISYLGYEGSNRIEVWPTLTGSSADHSLLPATVTANGMALVRTSPPSGPDIYAGRFPANLAAGGKLSVTIDPEDGPPCTYEGTMPGILSGCRFGDPTNWREGTGDGKLHMTWQLEGPDDFDVFWVTLMGTTFTGTDYYNSGEGIMPHAKAFDLAYDIPHEAYTLTGDAVWYGYCWGYRTYDLGYHDYGPYQDHSRMDLITVASMENPYE